MRKETYLSLPLAVEVLAAKSGVDIILRQNIAETTQTTEAQYDENGNVTAEAAECTVYECEERQMHYSGTVTAEAVSENFVYWWERAGGSTEVEAADTAAEAAGEPSVLERIEAAEAAIMDLAEVIANG